jgi:hypothetical protein
MTKSLAVPFLGLALIMTCAFAQPPAAAPGQSATPAPPPMRIDRQDAALDALIAPDAQIEKVATGFTFT